MSEHIHILKDKTRLDELCRLFATGLGMTERPYWEWRIFTPNGQFMQPEAIVAENEQGQLIGMCSTLLEEYGEHKWKCVKLCDWVVHPDYRGKGIISKLYQFMYQRYKNQEFDFFLSFPNSQSYPIFQKLGYNEKVGVKIWSSQQRLFMIKRPAKSMIIHGLEYRFTSHCPIQSFPLRPDRLVRTPEYMRWKYDKNPANSFQWLTVWNGTELIGYFVYAVTQGRLRRVITVYDWEFAFEAQDAFCQAVKLLEKQGNGVNIWGQYGQKESLLLKAAGFQEKACGTHLMLKAISEKGYPDLLTLTRVDTDY
ncbi:GNAT family N-acetyltransferase [Flavonifractor sp. An52]|uniref:GNAT family N-acetyltransferase n=1 Tax=Flavonifractor sp. An52 TaxID=1965642 RepID=UPI0013022EA9|nr:GNAT family N-acetyltransferase [Flavonifractor sp. An52]